MAKTKKQAEAAKPKQGAAKTRYEGTLTASSKRNRPAVYYKLSEKDHPTIIQGLTHFVSVYQIAAKIGCGYTTLKLYIQNHPELLAVQEDSQKGELEFVKGKFMQKIAAGSLGAMCFYLERKGGWTNRQQVDTNAPLPNIVLGVIPESELPSDGVGEPVSISPVQTLAQKDTSNTLERESPDEMAAEIVRAEKEAEEQEREDADAAAEDDFGDGEDWDDGESGAGLF